MTRSQDYYDTIRGDRNEWKESVPQRCMNCGREPGKRYGGRETVQWLEIHEICSRAHLPNAWWFRANGLLLCHFCHAKVAALSHAEQLAIKMRADPKHYDLQEWLRRRNPAAMNYVTNEEVEQCLKKTA